MSFFESILENLKAHLGKRKPISDGDVPNFEIRFNFHDGNPQKEHTAP